MPKDTSISKAKNLAGEKLCSSGLDSQDAKLLGMITLTGVQTAKLHSSFNTLHSLKIPYFDYLGKPLSDSPQAPAFYRLRYLEKDKSFAAATTKKIIRYIQEPNTRPVAYFPKNQDWKRIVKNVDSPLIITEGELKAAKACKEGFPTIGLGGVYSWKSLRQGITWLPSLECINWVRRNTYICFDSDYQTNPSVCNALKALADELEQRGAYIFLVTLPSLSGLEKVGLDDYLVHTGIKANDMFTELLSHAEPLGLSEPLWNLNNKYVYVKNPGLIVDQAEFFKASCNAFKDHLEASALYQERLLKPDGKISFKPVSAASAWLKWPLRKTVSKMTYAPGQEKFTTSKGHTFLNIWHGWGVEPKKGSVKPFLDLLKHLFEGSDKGALEWFMSWCAYPIQYPGTKMFSSTVFHGVKHGTGKSFIGYTLGKIYGSNFTEISQMDLHNSFNEWAESKQFVMGDDVTGSNKRQDADFLKKLITQREIRVNVKFVPSYVVPDCINYFFTANHPDSFFLEDDDRRYFIHDVSVSPLSEAFYAEYDLWLASDGAPALFHFLKNYKLTNFNPNAPAFRTSAKERMISNVQSDLAGWVRQLILNPSHILRVGDIEIDKDLFTNKELLIIYDAIGKTNITANGLGRELSRAGIRQVLKGRPVKLTDGSQSRYYAIRNHHLWLRSNAVQIANHLEAWLKPPEKRKGKY